MVDGHAVAHRTHARRIVGDHTADIGTVLRGRIGREMHAVRFEQSVEFVAHHPRLDSHPAFIEIQLQHAGQVFGDIQNYRLTDGLSGQAGTAAARQQRQTQLGALPDRLEGVLAINWYRYG